MPVSDYVYTVHCTLSHINCHTYYMLTNFVNI